MNERQDGRPAPRHLRAGPRPTGIADSSTAAVVVLACLAASLTLFGFGYHFPVEYQAYRDHGVVVTGRVIDYDEPGYRRPEAVEVAFTVSGEHLTLWTENYEAPLRVGDTVDLLVDSEQPTRFQALDWGYGRTETVLLWAAAGTALLVAGVTASLQCGRR